MNTRPGSLIQISSTVRIVEELLQRAETGYLVEHRAGDLQRIGQWRQRRYRGPIEVIGDDLLDQPAGGVWLEHRIQRAAADKLTYLVLDDCHAG